jgi:hypothetical protein
MAKFRQVQLTPGIRAGSGLWRFRQMDVNAVGGIEFLGRRAVYISKRDFSCRMLAEDPQSLSGNGVVLRGDAVAVTEDKRGGGSRLRGRHRSPGRRLLQAALLRLVGTELFNFIGQALHLDGKLHVIAVVTGRWLSLLRLGLRRIVVVRREAGNVVGAPVRSGPDRSRPERTREKRRAEKAARKEKWIHEGVVAGEEPATTKAEWIEDDVATVAVVKPAAHKDPARRMSSEPGSDYDSSIRRKWTADKNSAPCRPAGNHSSSRHSHDYAISRSHGPGGKTWGDRSSAKTGRDRPRAKSWRWT